MCWSLWNGLLSDKLIEKTALYWIGYIVVPTGEPISKMIHAVELEFKKDFRDLGWAALSVCKKSNSGQLI